MSLIERLVEESFAVLAVCAFMVVAALCTALRVCHAAVFIHERCQSVWVRRERRAMEIAPQVLLHAASALCCTAFLLAIVTYFGLMILIDQDNLNTKEKANLRAMELTQGYSGLVGSLLLYRWYNFRRISMQNAFFKTPWYWKKIMTAVVLCQNSVVFVLMWFINGFLRQKEGHTHYTLVIVLTLAYPILDFVLNLANAYLFNGPIVTILRSIDGQGQITSFADLRQWVERLSTQQLALVMLVVRTSLSTLAFAVAFSAYYAWFVAQFANREQNECFERGYSCPAGQVLQTFAWLLAIFVIFISHRDDKLARKHLTLLYGQCCSQRCRGVWRDEDKAEEEIQGREIRSMSILSVQFEEESIIARASVIGSPPDSLEEGHMELGTPASAPPPATAGGTFNPINGSNREKRGSSTITNGIV